MGRLIPIESERQGLSTILYPVRNLILAIIGHRQIAPSRRDPSVTNKQNML